MNKMVGRAQQQRRKFNSNENEQNACHAHVAMCLSVAAVASLLDRRKEEEYLRTRHGYHISHDAQGIQRSCFVFQSTRRESVVQCSHARVPYSWTSGHNTYVERAKSRSGSVGNDGFSSNGRSDRPSRGKSSRTSRGTPVKSIKVGKTSTSSVGAAVRFPCDCGSQGTCAMKGTRVPSSQMVLFSHMLYLPCVGRGHESVSLL